MACVRTPPRQVLVNTRNSSGTNADVTFYITKFD